MTHRKSLLVLALFSLVFISNCASYSQVLINNAGGIKRCAVSGHGPVGTHLAGNMQDECVSSAKILGYIEIEKAGILGIYTSEVVEQGGGLKIIRIMDKYPADKAGIKVGDILYKINSQEIHSKKDSKIMLFGEVGTKTTITIKNALGKKDYELIKERIPGTVK